MIKKDEDGKFVMVNKEKFYIGEDLDETIDDVLNLINSLSATEKIAQKYEDDEIIEITNKKIEFYSAVLKEIYES